MTRYVMHFDKELGEMVYGYPQRKESLGDAPYINPDSIDPVESYATTEGKIFDSKSALRRHYAEHGYEEGELKGEKQRAREIREFKVKMAEQRRADVAESLRKAKWNMAPLSAKERALCEKERQNLRDFPKIYQRK